MFHQTAGDTHAPVGGRLPFITRARGITRALAAATPRGLALFALALGVLLTGAQSARAQAQKLYVADYNNSRVAVFDVEGNPYGTTDPFNTVVRVSPDGTQTLLLTGADGLDGPTATAFGVGRDGKALYITNAAFPFFPGPNPVRRPSLMRLEVGIPGQPRP